MKTEERVALRRIDKQFDFVRSMPEPIPRTERYKVGIEDVGRGGYIRVKGQIYAVVEVSEYLEKKSKWYELELFGLDGGTSTYLEWERDDDIEVSFNQPPYTLRDIGLSADQVEEMSDEEAGSIRFQGRTFHYDDDYGAEFRRGQGEQGEPVYFYDFETEDENWCLSVEEWGSKEDGYEYEVFVSEYIEPDSIEVLVTGDGGPRS